MLPLGVSRYVLLLRVPEVSRPVQEIADFVSGIVIGTAAAMVFRLWAFKRLVFPHAEARPRPVSDESERSASRPGRRAGPQTQRS